MPGQRERFVFALPEPDGLVYVGVTDEPVDGPVEDVPAVPEADIVFLLEVLDSALAAPVGRADVVGAYAGLRPLLEVHRPAAGTADVSRRHALFTSRDGVITIVGGKLTTYRQMAEDAVDAAVRHRGLTAGPSPTRRLPLVGAAARADLARLAVASGRLVARYGTEAAGGRRPGRGGSRAWASPSPPGVGPARNSPGAYGTRARPVSRISSTGGAGSGWSPPTGAGPLRWRRPSLPSTR